MSNLIKYESHTNDFTGTLPSTLSGLSSCTYLSFRVNQFTGPIPTTLGLLPVIKELRLEHNRLTGPLPPELGNLSRLNKLVVTKNSLTGTIPSSYGNLVHLQYFGAAENTGVEGLLPASFERITSLSTLHLHQTGLRGIAESLVFWIQGVKYKDFSGTPAVTATCGGFPDVERNQALGLCVETHYLPEHRSMNCRGVSHVAAMASERPASSPGSVLIPAVPTMNIMAIPVSCMFFDDAEGPMRSVGASVSSQPLFARLPHQLAFEPQEMVLAHWASNVTDLSDKEVVFLDAIDNEWNSSIVVEDAPQRRMLLSPSIGSIEVGESDSILSGLQSACSRPGRCADVAIVQDAADERLTAMFSDVFVNVQQEAGVSRTLSLEASPLTPPLPVGIKSLGPSNGTTPFTLPARGVECVPWSSLQPYEVMYTEYEINTPQMSFHVANDTRSSLVIDDPWPPSALIAIWPNGKAASRGVLLGPRFSGLQPLNLPAVLSVVALRGDDALHMGFWGDGALIGAIQFPSSVLEDQLYSCIVNAHPTEAVATASRGHGTAQYATTPGVLLGFADLPLQSGAIPRWRAVEGYLWSQYLPYGELESLRSDLLVSTNAGVTLRNVAGAFVGIKAHCFVTLNDENAANGGAACFSILSASMITFRDSEFTLHIQGPAAAASASSFDAAAPQSFFWVQNSAVTFANCTFEIVAPDALDTGSSHIAMVRGSLTENHFALDCNKVFALNEWFGHGHEGPSRQVLCEEASEFVEDTPLPTYQPLIHVDKFWSGAFDIQFHNCTGRLPAGPGLSFLLMRAPMQLHGLLLYFTHAASGSGVMTMHVEYADNVRAGATLIGGLMLDSEPAILVAGMAVRGLREDFHNHPVVFDRCSLELSSPILARAFALRTFIVMEGTQSAFLNGVELQAFEYAGGFEVKGLRSLSMAVLEQLSEVQTYWTSFELLYTPLLSWASPGAVLWSSLPWTIEGLYFAHTAGALLSLGSPVSLRGAMLVNVTTPKSPSFHKELSLDRSLPSWSNLSALTLSLANHTSKVHLVDTSIVDCVASAAPIAIHASPGSPPLGSTPVLRFDNVSAVRSAATHADGGCVYIGVPPEGAMVVEFVRSYFHACSALNGGAVAITDVAEPADSSGGAAVSVSFTEAIMSSNSASGLGGAVYAATASSVDVSLAQGLLSHNVAQTAGGAGYFEGESLTVNMLEASIQDNTATVKAGGLLISHGASVLVKAFLCDHNNAVSLQGGCLSAETGARVVADHAYFRQNAAPTAGSVAIEGGSLLTLLSSGVCCSNSHFGAGIAVTSSSLSASNVVLANNTASGCGAAVAALRATVTLTGARVTLNSASECGGALYVYSSFVDCTSDVTLGPSNFVQENGRGSMMYAYFDSEVVVRNSSLVTLNGEYSGEGYPSPALVCEAGGRVALPTAQEWWGTNTPYDVESDGCSVEVPPGYLGAYDDPTFYLPPPPVTEALSVPPLGTTLSRSIFPLSVSNVAAVRLFVGSQEVNCTLNDTDIRYTVPSGSGAAVAVVAFVNGAPPLTSPIEYLNYAPPEIHATIPAILPRDGWRLQILGSNFGVPRSQPRDVVVSLGGLPCGNITVTKDTEIFCDAPAQTKANLGLEVSVGGQAAPVWFMAQIDPPDEVAITSLTIETPPSYNALPTSAVVTLDLSTGDTGGVPLQGYEVTAYHEIGDVHRHYQCPQSSCVLAIQPVEYGQALHIRARAVTSVYPAPPFGPLTVVAVGQAPLLPAIADLILTRLDEVIELQAPLSVLIEDNDEVLYPDGGSPVIAGIISFLAASAARPGCLIIFPQGTDCLNATCIDLNAVGSRCDDNYHVTVNEQCQWTPSVGGAATCMFSLPRNLFDIGSPYTFAMGVLTAAAWSGWTDTVTLQLTCPLGTGYAADIRDCAMCEPGTKRVVHSSGLALCVPCEPGTYQSDPGRSVCDPCTPGSVPDETQTQCVPCEIGNYQPKFAGRECHVCPEGSYSFHTGSAACTACPSSGVECNDGLLTLRQGFWRPPLPIENGSAILDEDSQLFTCPEASSCVATTLALEDEVLYSHECAEGYSGPVCGVCSPGYAQFGGVCSLCWSEELNGLAFSGSVLVMITLGVVLISRSRRSRTYSSLLLRTTLDYLQLLWITGEFSLRGPQLFRDWMGFSSVSNGISLDITFVQCSLNASYNDRFVMYMSLPFIIPLAVLLGMLLHRGARKLWQVIRRASRDRKPQVLLNAPLFACSVLVLLVVLHSRVAREVFAAFRCYPEPLPVAEQGEEMLYLNADVSTPCVETWRLAIAGTMGVLFVAGLPISIAAALYRYRAALPDKGRRASRQEVRIQKALGFLYSGYDMHRGLWWWESFVTFRKVCCQ